MEKYQGVKFKYHQEKTTFSYDERLPALNRWAYLFSQLGLAPGHADGAYGNQSYRTGDTSFVITKSAMIPKEILHADDFTHVIGRDGPSGIFLTQGLSAPSSETSLHYVLYATLPRISAILHGHCPLLNLHAEGLDIPVTKEFHAYGTPELAQSALDILDQTTSFFILREHGFVALGKDIATAGKLTLDYYHNLISILKAI